MEEETWGGLKLGDRAVLRNPTYSDGAPMPRGWEGLECEVVGPPREAAEGDPPCSPLLRPLGPPPDGDPDPFCWWGESWRDQVVKVEVE